MFSCTFFIKICNHKHSYFYVTASFVFENKSVFITPINTCLFKLSKWCKSVNELIRSQIWRSINTCDNHFIIDSNYIKYYKFIFHNETILYMLYTLKRFLDTILDTTVKNYDFSFIILRYITSVKWFYIEICIEEMYTVQYPLCI